MSRSEKEREGNVTSPSSHAPFHYLNTPEKAKRYQQEHKLRRSCEHRIARLTQRLAEAVEERGFTEDSALNNDLSQIMEQNAKSMRTTYPSGTFARIFWDSQAHGASLKDPRQMRLDPMMVRWCLYLQHLSSSAYEVVRESGAIRLPSQRTLRDYTYHTKAVAAFSRGVDEQLKIAAKLPLCPEREKCEIIVFDEMHLREDLSYDKHTGRFEYNLGDVYVVHSIHAMCMSATLNICCCTECTAGALNGFTDIGDINSLIATYENQLSGEEIAKPLATSMLVMMVIGLFSNLKYPYAQFPCTELSGM